MPNLGLTVSVQEAADDGLSVLIQLTMCSLIGHKTVGLFGLSLGDVQLQRKLDALYHWLCMDVRIKLRYQGHADGFVQDCSISIANALEILQYVIKASIHKYNIQYMFNVIHKYYRILL